MRIAFDGDAVLFSDEAERVFQRDGLDAFTRHETAHALKPLPPGPFKPLLEALHRLQAAAGTDVPMRVRTALVTARSAPAHERAVRTLMDWNIAVDEALFLGGLDKGEFLKAFQPDFYFDDQRGARRIRAPARRNRSRTLRHSQQRQGGAMKAIRILLFGIAGLIALAVLALGAALAIVDGQFVKTRLEAAMKEKNRTLKIDGVPQVKLFPVAGLALGKTSLSEPGSDKPFLSLDSAEVAVRVMPLLSGEVAVETLKLSGLKANVVRRKDGTMNFSDLTGKGGEKSAEGKAPPNLRIAEVNVEKVQLA